MGLDMTDQNWLSEEALQGLRTEQEKLETENNMSYLQLTQAVPNMQMDTTGARLQCLVDALTATVWNEADRITFEIAFQTKVKEALDHTWKQVREQKAKQALIKPASQSGKLFGPGGRPLN